MKNLLRAVLVAAFLASCTEPETSPDLLRIGDTLYIRGMALGETSRAAAERLGQVEHCRQEEALAAIVGPTDYCQLRDKSFGGADTTTAAVHFKANGLSSIHINAPSSAFMGYVTQITGSLGQATSPPPLADGQTPAGQANITDGEGRKIVSDYRVWDTPMAYVTLYETATGKTGQLALMIRAPVSS